MAKKMVRLIQEQDDKSKKLRAGDLFEKMQEGLKNLSRQEIQEPTSETVREEVLPSNPLKDPQ
jgi:hypothetical protein